MNRRDAMFALLALGAGPRVAEAQQSKAVPRIGVLRTPPPTDHLFQALLGQALVASLSVLDQHGFAFDRPRYHGMAAARGQGGSPDGRRRSSPVSRARAVPHPQNLSAGCCAGGVLRGLLKQRKRPQRATSSGAPVSGVGGVARIPEVDLRVDNQHVLFTVPSRLREGHEPEGASTAPSAVFATGRARTPPAA